MRKFVNAQNLQSAKSKANLNILSALKQQESTSDAKLSSLSED